MATTTTITKLLFRRGNDDDRKQTILASGEPGWVLDRKRLYIGDGVTPGGVPALSAREDHLHYVDTIPGSVKRWTTVLENNIAGGAQFLDINVPGLSHTLAGMNILPDRYLRWFHPASQDIRTMKDLVFTNDSDFNGAFDADFNETAAIYHEGNKEFFIGKRNSSIAAQNTINIGDAIIITPLANGKKSVAFSGEVDSATFQAVSAVFDNGVHTIFEDKTVDLNTAMKSVTASDNTVSTRPYDAVDEASSTSDSNGAGLYITHKNWLSAGHISIGLDPTEIGRGSIELQPTVYHSGWESYDNEGFGSTPVSGAGGFLGRTPSFSSKLTWSNPVYKNGETSDPSVEGNDMVQTNGSGYVGTYGWAPKPLVFHSVRPGYNTQKLDQWGSSFAGDPHFVFESGLIVYDAGDPVTGSYNAYKINQSVDTRNAPRFTGLKIRTDLHETDKRVVDNGKARLGVAIPVDSGGTGQNEFTPGSVIKSDGNWNDATQINDNALQSVRLEQGAFLVGTDAQGAVAHKFTKSEWIQIDYSDGTIANETTGRRDGVIKLNNTFAPDFLILSEYDDARKLWFAKFDEFLADNGVTLTATGQSDGKDPGEVFSFIGDYYAPTEETSENPSRGGTIRTVGLQNSTPGNRKIRIEHNNLASYLFDQSPVNATRVLKYTRGDETNAIKNVLTNELFAGQTYEPADNDSAHVKWYLNGLMPVTVDDPDNDTPSDYVNKGYVMAGVQIDAGGHLIGFRSKDLDDRYPQMFYLGTGWKENDQAETRIQSPADHTENVSTLTDTNISTDAIGVKVEHNDDIGSTTENAYVPKNYMGDKTGDAVVLTDINFNNYGTVHSYNTHDLTEIFYDKSQISSLAQQIYTHVDQLSATIDDVQDNTFKRDASSHTNNTGVVTRWYDKNTVLFSHTRSLTGSTIRQKSVAGTGSSITVDWVFDAEHNTDFYVPTNRNIEWRHKSSNGDSTIKLMSLDALGKSGDDTLDGDTRLRLYDGDTNVARFEFLRDTLNINDENEVTKVVLNSDGITLGDGGADLIRLHGTAERAHRVWTQRATSSTATEKPWYHVSFVLNNNTASANAAGAQIIKTDSTLQFSPDNDVLKVTGDILIAGSKGSYDGYFKGKLQGSTTRVDVTSTEYKTTTTDDNDNTVVTWTDRSEAMSGSTVDKTFYLTFVHNNNITQNDWDEQQMFTNRHLLFDANSELLKVQGTGGVQIWNDLTLGTDTNLNPDDRDVKIRFHEEKNSYQLIPGTNGDRTVDLYNEILWRHIDNMVVPDFLDEIPDFETNLGGEFQLYFDKTEASYALLHDGNIEAKLNQLAMRNGGFITLPEVRGNGSYIMQDEDYFFKGNLVGDVYSEQWYTDTRAGVEKDERRGEKILENGTNGHDAWFRGDVVLNDANNTVLVDIASSYFKGTADKADRLRVKSRDDDTELRLALVDNTDPASTGDMMQFWNDSGITVVEDDNGDLTLSCNIQNSDRAKSSGLIDTVDNGATSTSYLTFVDGNNTDAETDALYTNSSLKILKSGTQMTLTCDKFDGRANVSDKIKVSICEDSADDTTTGRIAGGTMSLLLGPTTANQSADVGVDRNALRFNTHDDELYVGSTPSITLYGATGNIDASGTITAGYFSGDGASLANVELGADEAAKFSKKIAKSNSSDALPLVVVSTSDLNSPLYGATNAEEFTGKIVPGTGALTVGSITCGTISAGSNNISTTGTISGGTVSGNISGGTVSGTNFTATGTLTVTSTTTLKNSLTVADGSTYKSITCGGISANGAITSTGDITAFSSDARLKENLEPITDATNKVKQIVGYTYNFNEAGCELTGEDQQTRHAGVLAQDVEKVLPEVIAAAPADENYKTVKYDKLVPLLIESIKELSARVEQLESQLK